MHETLPREGSREAVVRSVGRALRWSRSGELEWIILLSLVLFLTGLFAADGANAFRLIGSGGRWLRWDAAPRTVGGEERSLDGGLRYSLEGGSYPEQGQFT